MRLSVTESEDGPGVGEQVGDTRCGQRGVDGHERRAGLDHGPQGDDGVEAARERQCDHGFRSGAVVDELVREPVGGVVEFGVGELPVAVQHRDAVRVRGDTGGQDLGEGPLRQRRRHRVRQCAIGFGVRQEHDVADGSRRVGRARVEQLHPPRGEVGGGRLVEQVGRVGEFGDQPADLVLTQRDVDVELGDGEIRCERFDPQPGQFKLADALVLQRQRDLEQRRVTLRAHRIDGFDHLVERHIGVREGREVGGADLLEELRERRRGIDAGAQDEGVDEHADEVVEGTITATGDRRAHRHVLGAAETREQHGEGGVQDHEAGRAVGVGEAVDAGEDLGGDPEAGVGAPVGRCCGSRAVGGQFEHGRGVGEHRGPVVELLRDRCLRILRIAEHGALPQREVGVLHRQRFPGRLRVVEARGVGDEDVTGERHGRRAVGADVVHDHHEHVGAVVLAEQRAADGDLTRDVEAASHDPGDRGVQCVGVGCVDRGEIERHVAGGEHVLRRPVLVFREDRAQRFVPVEHVADGGGEGVDVEVAAQAHRERDVVERGRRVEAVEEPHALLRVRQRHPRGAFLGHERQPLARADVRAGGLGEGLHGGSLEHRAHRHRGAERFPDPGHQSGRDERVAAEREEVVVEAHAFDAEQFGDDLGHRLLDGVGGGTELASDRVGRGQRLAVELAVGGQRHLVEDDERRGNHVPGQELGDEAAGLDRFGHVLTDEITDELRGAGRIGAHHRRGAGDAGDAQQSGIDLTEFDAESPDLDLVVDPAAVDEPAVLGPLHEIAGAVQAGVRTGRILRVRIRDEPRRGEGGRVEIPPDHARPGHVQLTLGSGRHGRQSRVEDVDAQVGDRTADDRRLGVGDLRDEDVDAALGGAVEVEGRTPAFAQAAPQPLGDGIAAETEGGHGAVREQAVVDELLELTR